MPMRHVTLRQLRVFEAVARHRSFSRAAEELHLTQPAVSMQVKSLEQQTSIPLFEQIGKKIYLTEAGQELYARSPASWTRPRRRSTGCAGSSMAGSPSASSRRESTSPRSCSAGFSGRTLA